MINVTAHSVLGKGWPPCDFCGSDFKVGDRIVEVDGQPDTMTIHVDCAQRLARQIEWVVDVENATKPVTDETVSNSRGGT